MFFSETDLSDFIEENDVKFIRMTFCDTFGNMKNIAIMPRELHRAITDGIPFNATGLLEASHQNLLLKPDTSTLSILPWRPQSGRVVRFFCKLYHMDGTPYEGDLRRNLGRSRYYRNAAPAIYVRRCCHEKNRFRSRGSFRRADCFHSGGRSPFI